MSFKDPVINPTDNREEGLDKHTERRKARTKRASNDTPEQLEEPLRKKKKRASRNAQKEVPTGGESSVVPEEPIRDESTAVPENPNVQAQQNPQEPEQPEQPPSVMANAIVNIYRYNAPSGDFDITTTGLRADFNAKFKESFAKRPCCAVVAVDLEQFYKEFNLDLSPWLKIYENFLSISVPYSANLVRLFYFNMQTDNLLNSEGALIEERFTTHVRGTKFTISPSVLNSILNMNPFPVANFTYTNDEIWSILRPETPFPEDQSQLLSFTPTSMSTRNRILWYIFSRNFIQKGGNFTHFARRDYPIFAGLVNQVPFDLGHHIFHEMLRFKFPTRRLSHMPFPSFISIILF